VRVSGAVFVLVTDRRVVVVRPVVSVVGARVGVGVAVATAAGWSGALDERRFSLAKIVMPPKLLRVIAAASARSTSVELMSGRVARRGRLVMLVRGTSRRRASMKAA
jgi:hypothetical protein